MQVDGKNGESEVVPWTIEGATEKLKLMRAEMDKRMLSVGSWAGRIPGFADEELSLGEVMDHVMELYAMFFVVTELLSTALNDPGLLDELKAQLEVLNG